MCGLPLRTLIIFAACALICFGYTGLLDGQVRVKGGRLAKKEETPVSYWTSVGVYFIAGGGGLLFAFSL